jgi:hypothetical protein
LQHHGGHGGAKGSRKLTLAETARGVSQSVHLGHGLGLLINFAGMRFIPIMTSLSSLGAAASGLALDGGAGLNVSDAQRPPLFGLVPV